MTQTRETFGPKARSVTAHAGWFNRAWEPSLRLDGCVTLSQATSDLGAAGAFPTSSAGHAWSLEKAARKKARGMKDVDIDAAGSISVPPIDLKTFARRKLGDRAYWLRQDGGVLLYICGYRTVRRGPDGDEVPEPLDMPAYSTDLTKAVDRAIDELPRDKLWFTYHDIRNYFGVSRATVARRLREGLVPGVSLAGRCVLEESSVRRFDRVQLRWLLLSVRYRCRQSTPDLAR